MGGAAGRELSRRDLLKGIGVGAGALGVMKAGGATASESDIEPLFTGYVESIEHPRTAHVAVYEGGTVRVEFEPRATFVRDGNVSINAFEAGDHVAVVGTWSGDAVAGESMEVLYELREGVIESRTQDRLDTTNGPMYLIANSRPMDGGRTPGKPLEELEPGDTIVAAGRVDGSEGDFFALTVGVVR